MLYVSVNFLKQGLSVDAIVSVCNIYIIKFPLIG